MKKILFIGFVALVLASCDRPTESSSDSNTSEINKEQEQLAEEPKQDVVENKDTSSNNQNASENKIDSFTYQMNQLNIKVDDLQREVDSLHSKSKDMMDKNTAYTFMIILFIIGIISSGVVYYLLNNGFKKLDYRIRKRKEEIFNINSVLGRDLYEVKSRLGIIEGASRSRRVQREVTPQNTTPKPTPGSSPQTTTPPTKTTPPSNKDKVFYMPRTINEGEFDDSKKTSTKNEDTYFMFKLLNGAGTMASFIFDACGEEAVRRSFDDRDRSMATVCNITIASVNNNPHMAETTTPGVAELKNGKWIVKQKMELKYV